jgi:hypothetical protein
MLQPRYESDHFHFSREAKMPQQLHREYFIYKLISNILLKLKANWTGNLNYWTGGFQQCRGQLGWSSEGNFVPIAENLTWAPNQPDLLIANCLHMRIHKNASSTALSARNCTDKYIYACEVRNL